GTMGIYPTNNFTMQVGTVEAWVNPSSSATRKQYLFSADGGKSLNGDKYNDYVFGETGFDPVPNTSKIFFGTGSGLNTASPLTFPSFVVRGIVTGDVDGDQQADMLVNNNGANEVWIFDGPFSAGQTLIEPDAAHRLSVPSPQGSALADFDGDGDLDVMIASYAGTAPLYGFENDGTGNFTPMIFNFFGWTAPYEGIDVADFDHDGILDVVGGSFTTSPTQPSLMFKGLMDGSGNYTLSIADPAFYQVLDTGILGVKAADLDNDGWADIALANLVTDQVIVWYNDKTGHFPNNATYRKPFSVPDPFTLSIADIDNDGYVDVGVAQYKPNGVSDNTTSRFLRGPAFNLTKTYPVNNAVSLSVGDMDGDGLNDVGYHSSTGTNCPVHFLNVHGNIKSTLNITCQATYNSVNGPGSAVFASNEGTSPYGPNANQYNDMEIYFDN
ncbi:MAG: VCBS repeat-containing protein, partial [archaeon]